MGREIRRVPPDWEHPRKYGEPDRYDPLFDKAFDEAMHKWNADWVLWKEGKHPDQGEPYRKDCAFEDWDPPPNPDTCRKRIWTVEEATAFQVYETVSEGTPVSPVFNTREELIDYLVENGDFWDQRRFREGLQDCAGWSREAAENFVKDEWKPTMVISL